MEDGPQTMDEREQVERYYARHYGAPDRRREFRASDGCAIDVLEWSADKTGEDVIMYASLGAAQWLRGPHTFCEFFIGLARPAEGVVETIAEVASEGVGKRGSPDPGDSITLPEPLWAGTRMRALLFTDGDELLAPIRVDGKAVRFLQLVPLYPEELALKSASGEEALWELFEAQEVPYWDPMRAPARMAGVGR